VAVLLLLRVMQIRWTRTWAEKVAAPATEIGLRRPTDRLATGQRGRYSRQ
jgi:hypothetical protein